MRTDDEGLDNQDVSVPDGYFVLPLALTLKKIHMICVPAFALWPRSSSDSGVARVICSA